MKLKTPQRQFKNKTAPQQHVMPHSMENREAGSPSAMRKRDSVAPGFQTQARPGISGIYGRPKIKKPSRRGR